MKRWMRVICVMAMAVVCSLTAALPAFAEETPGVEIPVSVSLSGTLPSPAEDFKITLKADDAAYPMPEGAENGTYSMTITGADKKALPTMRYSRVGIYTYTILQEAGSNKKCTYDGTVYYLKVTISNKIDKETGKYNGLEATAVLRTDPNNENKLDEALFKNVYETEHSSSDNTPTPTEEPAPTPTPVPQAVPLNAPRTGDSSSLVLYVVVFGVCLAALAVLFAARKGKKSK